MIIKECKNCKKKKTMRAEKQFCSRRCYHDYRTKMNFNNCLTCDKSFPKKHKKQLYCSNSCASFQKRKYGIVACGHCKNEFQANHHKFKFCSSFCFLKGKAKRPRVKYESKKAASKFYKTVEYKIEKIVKEASTVRSKILEASRGETVL